MPIIINNNNNNIPFSGSQDGFISSWSVMSGLHLAAFHFNHTLIKLLVSQSGGTNYTSNKF